LGVALADVVLEPSYIVPSAQVSRERGKSDFYDS
jgi:hypothetical protein